MIRVPSDLMADLILLTAVLVFGALLARALLGEWVAIRIASLAFPLGSGLLTWLIFLLSWLGLRIDLPSVVGLLVGGSVVSWAIIRGTKRREVPGAPVGEGGSRASDRSNLWLLGLVGAVAVAFIAANLYISIARSYSVWDSAAIWSVKGYGIAREGSIFAGREWGAHGLAYPLNIPILVTVFALAGGDPLPGSKGLFPLYFASLLLGVYQYGRSHGMRRETAAVAALCVASIPLVFMESTTGYANAPMTVYLVLGALAVVDGWLTSSTRELLTGGFLFGLAGWTRVEGAFYAAFILVAGIVVMAASGKLRLKWMWPLVPLAVLTIPWLVFYRLYGAESSQAVGALTQAVGAMRQGVFHLGALRLVLGEVAGSLTDFRAWGWIWILTALIAALGFRGASRQTRLGFLAMVSMSAATVVVTVLLFYVGSYGMPEFRGWLSGNFDRFFLPSPILLFLGVVWLMGHARSAEPGASDLGDAQVLRAGGRSRT